MNRILRFFYAALIVSTAVACHTSEIDNPNNDNQDKPKAYDNIILTASIKQTRVDYSINGDKLEQRWAENDVIYGFYGGSTANKVVFSVESVDEETGVASLKPESGWGGFLSAFKENKKLAVGLVYTGCTTTDLSKLFKSDDTIEVDMANQGTERVPACMHADSFSTRTEDDVTYVIFEFQNDCSIIEVFSFTGVKENIGHYFSGDEATLISIVVNGLIEGCKYSLDNNGDLKFESIDKLGDDDAPTTVTLGGDWSVTKDGDITYDGNIKPVFIAAVPYKYTQFTVSANLDNALVDTINLDPYTNKELKGGNSYYIMANPVVAKTVDNVYFKTVYDAFEHAEYLDGNPSLLQGRTNTVTLLVDEINGLGEQVAEPAYDKSITIDYDVTLDLNGCTLLLSEAEQFYLDYPFNVFDNPGTLTIQDSTGPNSTGAYAGTISSNSDNPILYNLGVVNIHGGNLKYYGDNNLIHNSGTVNISDGFLESYAESDEEIEEYYSVVYNEATLNIYGGTLNSVNCDTIINDGTATISGGKITSTNGFAVNNCEDAISTISGGTITSTNFVAVNNEGDLTISGGDLYSKSEDREYVPGTIENYSTLKISGGKVESDNFFPLYNSGDGTVEITGGKLISYDDSAIYSRGDVTIGKTVENEISISSSAPMYSNYTSAAIYMLEGSNLEIYSGTVTSSVGTSAIILEGAEGNITGGVISNKSNSKETVQILDGASCIISGGVIYSEGDIATIACRSTSKVSTEKSKLWITWPEIRNDEGEIIGYDPGSVEGPYEPLIYSFGSAYQLSPITANYDNMDNTAEVYIQGGYLLAHNQNSYGFFYNDDASPQGKTEGFDNLILSGCGQFYANTYRVNMQGSTYSSNCDIDLHSYFSVSEYSGLSYIPGFFKDYFDKKDFVDGFPKETVLYYFDYK